MNIINWDLCARLSSEILNVKARFVYALCVCFLAMGKRQMTKMTAIS